MSDEDVNGEVVKRIYMRNQPVNDEDMNGEVVKRIYMRNQCLDGLGRVWEFDMTKMRWVLTSRTELQFVEKRPGMRIGELSVRKLDI